MSSRITMFAAIFIAAAFLTAPSALAQDDNADDVRIRAKQVTIEVDDEGRILVDGARLSDQEGDVLLRVEPEDGDVEVEVVAPRRRYMKVRSNARDGREGIHVRRRADHAHARMRDFDFDFDVDLPRMRDLAPMMERFHFDIGDPLRESLEEHREVAELERESRDLARKARQAEGAERSALESELRAHLADIFAKKLELREQRIANLEDKLGDERQKLQRRREAREDMIDRRLRTLMGEDDILDW